MIFFAWSVSACAGDNVPLTAEQCAAIATAEAFVRDNGYTDAPASTDVSKWRAELFEDRLPLAAVVAARRRQLMRHAVGLFRGVTGEGPGWSVVFLYDPAGPAAKGADGSSGRGVYVPPSDDPNPAEPLHLYRVGVTLRDATIRLGTPDATARSCGWR